LFDGSQPLCEVSGMRRPKKPSAKRADLANLTEHAYRKLEKMIATLELAPGTLVSEGSAVEGARHRSHTGARSDVAACP
jgi:hypothetical protein